jgi:4-amino-4-deoxychorismate lyase
LNTNQYFETIRCEDQEIYNLHYHKNRIASTIGLNLQIEEYIYPPSNELLKCKLIYDASGILDITYTPYQKKQIRSFKLVYDDTISYSKKSLNRNAIEHLYLQKDNCDEIIIVKNGLITDTSIANIAILYNDVWITPKTPLLNGTTKQRYLDNQFLKEKDITVDMLQESQEIALLNAMIEFDIKTDFAII